MSLTPAVLPPALDLAGVAVFALTGALLAARLRQTFVTMAFFALITGVGGGSCCAAHSRTACGSTMSSSSPCTIRTGHVGHSIVEKSQRPTGGAIRITCDGASVGAARRTT